MLLLILFLLLDGLASLVVALAIFSNLSLMALDLKALQDRRLENLDKSIDYFGSRLAHFRKRRSKVTDDILNYEVGSAEHTRAAIDLAVLDAQIRLIDDVISYLKLC